MITNDVPFVVSLLTNWVLTGGDFETLLTTAIKEAHLGPEDEKRLTKAARDDFERLLEADQAYLRRLRGDPKRLSDVIAGILRW